MFEKQQMLKKKCYNLKTIIINNNKIIMFEYLYMINIM